MRALDWMVLFSVICGCIALVPVLVPSYNNGNGLAVGNSSVSWLAQWQISGTGSLAQTVQNSNNFDPVTYALQIIVSSVTTFLSIVSIVFVAYPVLVSVFGLAPAISVVIQIILTFAETLGIAQVVRGGFTWKWNE